MKNLSLTASLLIAIVSAMPCRAQDEFGAPAIMIENIGARGGGLAANIVEGWEFSVEEPVRVTELGIWDHKLDGFATEIPMALWDSKGKLLAQTVIPAGKIAQPVDSFRYVSVDPVELEAKKNYVIGAYYTPETKESIGGSSSNTQFYTDGAIRWVGRRRVLANQGLEFPQPKPQPANAIKLPGGFGPSFLVERGTTPRIFHRMQKVNKPSRYAMLRLPENPDGSHKDSTVVISLFANKNSGKLTQVVVNGKAMGSDDDGLAKARKAIETLADEFKELAGELPPIQIIMPSWGKLDETIRLLEKSTGPIGKATDRNARVVRIDLAKARRHLANPNAKGRFSDHGGFIEDTWTGLLWHKNWQDAGKRNYFGAADYAKELALGSLTDWRVPTIEELSSIFPATSKEFGTSNYTPDRCCQGPTEFASYWTSELDNSRPNYAYVYHWYAQGGANNCFADANRVYVRCVHDRGTLKLPTKTSTSFPTLKPPTPMPAAPTPAPATVTEVKTPTVARPTEPPRRGIMPDSPVQFAQVLVGHKNTVFSSAFSHDGSMLATGDHGGNVIVWDWNAGKKIAFLKAHSGPVRQLAFSENDLELATAGPDSKAKVWLLPSVDLLGTYSLATSDKVVGLHFLGSLFPVTLQNQRGQLFQFTVPGMGGKPWKHRALLHAKLSHGHDAVITAHQSGSDKFDIRVVDYESGQVRSEIRDNLVLSPQLRLSPDGSRVLASRSGRDRDGMLLVWDLKSSRRLRFIKHHFEMVQQAAISADNRFLCAAGSPTNATSQSVEFWSLSGGNTVQIYREGAKAAFAPQAAGHSYAVASHPEVPLFATAGAGGDVMLWKEVKKDPPPTNGR